MNPATIDTPSPSIELVLRPTRNGLGLDFAELTRYRELLLFLTWRDLRIRYKQTALGFGWAVIQPLLSLVAFSAIFGGVAKMPSEGLPYPVFAFAGLLPWQFFQNGVSLGGQSLVNQQQIITKVYFPRLFVPTASVGVGLVNLAIALVMFVGVSLYYGVTPTWTLLLLPVPILFTVFLTLGVSYWLAAVTVTYRDLRYAVPFLLQVWMYVSPLVYPAGLVPEKWRWLMWLNPMAGVIDTFRACVAGRPWPVESASAAAVGSLVLLFWGIRSFGRMERGFADIA